ncbi:tetratricopeptide repeat protein [Alteromonadaceae bacterium BrNp21-10]|nr:tetratricopeptide repeat protein [Alteromonadaceae bacterium BrNp21-10]
MWQKCLLVLIISTGLGACQSNGQVSLSPDAYIHDEGFPGYDQKIIETQDELFALNQPVVDYLQQNIMIYKDKSVRLRELVAQLFNPQKINLLYATDANSTASETFNLHTANCLSMSILAYAMADFVGLQSELQDVLIPEFWDIRQGYSFINGHVNLRVKVDANDKGVLVDFNDSFTSGRFSKTLVSKALATTMFYNNKGAMAMIENDYTLAYRYFRQALMLAPDYIPSWSNMGVLYRISGHSDWAEEVYKAALIMDSDSLNVLDNLAILYDITKRKSDAHDIRAKIERRRQDNPYYHYYLGELAYQNRDWRQATKHYRRAIRLESKEHQFYFSLARTYSQMGKLSATRKNLSLAKRHSDTDEQYNRYASKLTLLHH